MATKLNKNKKTSKAQIAKRQSEILIKELQCIDKYYLVGINGRTSFILENMNSRKFKITIGNDLKCSCAPDKSQHCIHTIYTLIQIFDLPVDHPLLFQNQYTNKQLRHIIANRMIHQNKIQDFLKCIKHRSLPKVIMEEKEEEQEDQQNLCAICQMEIVKQDLTTTCFAECRNTFHHDCFMQWAKHKVDEEGIISCPLCRDMKPVDFLNELKKKQYQHKETLISKKVGKEFYFYCDGCELKEISPQQTVYKCIVCEDVTLCSSCFNLGKHIRHSFIYKNGGQQKWQDCEDRKRKRKLDQEQGLIRMKLPNNSRRLFHFLASSLPCYFSKNTRWNVVECKKLDIKIEELECIACNDKRKIFLRRLKCGHFIHHKCLKRRIQKNLLFCKLDGQKFLLGYASLLKHEKLNKQVLINGSEDESEQEEKYEKNMKGSPSKSLTKSLRTSTSLENRKKVKSVKSIHNGSFIATNHSLAHNPE